VISRLDAGLFAGTLTIAPIDDPSFEQADWLAQAVLSDVLD
jgi:hypothetical protein